MQAFFIDEKPRTPNKVHPNCQSASQKIIEGKEGGKWLDFGGPYLSME